jgi:hypothetical protein
MKLSEESRSYIAALLLSESGEIERTLSLGKFDERIRQALVKRRSKNRVAYHELTYKKP